ncbi:hypothetical protein [Burkholderia alba]|uniref:hypothetical protein n=1 Tax=Burkholderia alba TaxID=2683677 RepID=UPI002B059D25|nr:hypothetical protein [Burkholderia alba]
MNRSTLVLLGALALPGAARAGAAVEIDTRAPLCAQLNNVRDTTIESDPVIRTAGATACAAQYRLAHGLASLPPGTVFKLVWQDGSWEKIRIVSLYSDVGAVPERDSQHPSDTP